MSKNKGYINHLIIHWQMQTTCDFIYIYIYIYDLDYFLQVSILKNLYF